MTRCSVAPKTHFKHCTFVRSPPRSSRANSKSPDPSYPFPENEHMRTRRDATEQHGCHHSTAKDGWQGACDSSLGLTSVLIQALANNDSLGSKVLDMERRDAGCTLQSVYGNAPGTRPTSPHISVPQRDAMHGLSSPALLTAAQHADWHSGRKQSRTSKCTHIATHRVLICRARFCAAERKPKVDAIAASSEAPTPGGC